MRDDDIGIFWQDFPTARGKNKIAPIMPDIPETGWQLPTEFPNLKLAKVISLDLETYDPELITNGPGWARGKGHIVGVSVAADDFKAYYPMRHEIEPHINHPPEKVLTWLSDILDTESIPKLGANLMYDIGWLRHEGVTVKGDFYDVQFAEALLTEASKVDLDTLGKKYLGIGKTTNLLYDWCSNYYGGTATEKQRANIYRSPARLVGHYAEGDAVLPLQMIGEIYKRLKDESLVDLFEMECKLIPLLLDMRFEGVSVDLDRAEQAREGLIQREKESLKRIKDLAGFEVNVNASASLAQAFDKIGLKYPRTKPTSRSPKGQPSFTKEFLKTVDHPIAKLVIDIKSCRKMNGTFIEGYILNSHVNGKVYGQFHPLRGNDNGARSGRFSSSNPNLQNIPSRDKVLAPLLRGIFIPDPGHKQWRKYDYSQIEYRFLVHFAIGGGADAVRQQYIKNPKTDYHKLTQLLVKEKTGIELERKPIKNINFGLIYGMGQPKLARSIGVALNQAKILFQAYHNGAPFAKATMDDCIKIAQNTGMITTILGRRSRFNLWQPRRRGKQIEAVALPYNLALRKWGSNIERAYVHKALNRRLQGSAADMLKYSMLKCYQDGVFAETGVPRLTVHDELDFSDPGGHDDAFKEMHHILETAMPLRIPVLLDSEIGPDWGHLQDEV